MAVSPAAVQPAALAADIPDPPEAGWESNVSEGPAPTTCREIDPVFVIPVRAVERPAAIARLRSASAIPIGPAEVAQLSFDVPPARTALRYQRLLRQKIDVLLAERHTAVVDRVGSWTEGDEQRLRDLVDLYHDDTAPQLHPFLVRAVAMNEQTGAFHARLCGGDLWIDHASLGRASPFAIRLPVIIYLAQRPQAVFVTWSVAY